MRLFLLISFVFSLAGNALANERSSCINNALARLAYSESEFHIALERVPELRDLVLGVMQAPEAPIRVKSILKRGIQDKSLSIQYMSETIAALRSDVAFYQGAFEPFERVSAEELKKIRLGKRLPEHEIDPRFSRPRVVIRNELSRNEDTIFLAFIHELAHARFSSFLAKNIAMLASRWPQFIVRSVNGHYAIYDQFLVYLHERYAFEIEYSALKTVRPSFEDQWLRQFEEASGTSKVKRHLSQNASRGLSEIVTKLYGLNDPVLEPFHHLSIGEILRGH